MLSDKTKRFLAKEEFVKYSGLYLGCPHHGTANFACPTDSKGDCECKDSDAPYWSIGGKSAKAFVASITRPAITYLFVEQTGEVRKIGEGRPQRILDDLKAHYNHGRTKASRTQRDRASGNTIARKCRLAGEFALYLRCEASKNQSQTTKAKVKHLLSGWLDYDQGGTGTPSTV